MEPGALAAPPPAPAAGTAEAFAAAPAEPASRWPAGFRDKLAAVAQGRATLRLRTDPLPESAFERRHRIAVAVLAAHAVGLAALGAGTGQPWILVFAVAGIPGGLAALAWGAPGRRAKGLLASAGLLAAAGGVAVLSGGFLEAQLSLLLVLRVIALYQDWSALLLALGALVGQAGLAAAVPGLSAPWPGLAGSDAVWLLVDIGLAVAVLGTQVLAWSFADDTTRTFHQVLRHSAGSVLRLDMQGRITFVNPAAEALTGYPAERLLGEPAEPLFASRAGLSLHQPDGCPLHAALRGSPPQGIISAELRRNGGAKLPVDLVCGPVLEGDRVVGAVISLTDMSQRERAEAARQVARDQQQEIERLRQMDSFRRLFLNTASHELNTPLTPIIIHVDLLRSGELGPLNDGQQKSIDQLHRNVGRLAELVNDVLDVGRMENGRLRLEKRVVDLGLLVDDAAETFRATARRAGVELRVNAPRGVAVEADGKRLAQVVFNLVSNALKFTPPAGRITVLVARSGRDAVLSVQDTGVGIAAEDLPKLFQPFSQLSNELRHGPRGTGLGLFISKGIAEQHGGTLQVESGGRGKGSRFIVHMPLASATPGAAARRQEEAPVASPAAR